MPSFWIFTQNFLKFWNFICEFVAQNCGRSAKNSQKLFFCPIFLPKQFWIKSDHYILKSKKSYPQKWLFFFFFLGGGGSSNSPDAIEQLALIVKFLIFESKPRFNPTSIIWKLRNEISELVTLLITFFFFFLKQRNA